MLSYTEISNHMCPLVTASDNHTNVNLSSVELCWKHSSWIARMMRAQVQRTSKIYEWSGVNQKEAQARDKRTFVFYFVLLLYLHEWLCLYRVLVIMLRSLRNTYSVLSFFFFELVPALLYSCDQTFDQLHGILNASSNLLSLLFSATLWNEPGRNYLMTQKLSCIQ